MLGARPRAHINETTFTHFDQNWSIGCLLTLYGSIKHPAQLCGDFVLGEHDEPEDTVMDQMLNDPHSDTGDLLPTSSSVDLNTLVNTFTESQLRAYRWVEGQFNQNKQVVQP